MRRRLASTIGMAVLAGSMAAFAAAPARQAVRPLADSAESRTATILTQVSESWFRGEWDAYRARFVSGDGRVIDNANGGISHSEGQGYGLLLALAANDGSSFATIWRWTFDHLRKRPDALFAWKWDPVKQQVGDLNDAADGDILIAWALTRAARRFDQPEYEVEAREIIKDIAAKLVRSSVAGPILMPAAKGFGAADQPDGPVVNLSYWVFPALRDFSSLAPDTDWSGVRRTGYELLNASQFGSRRLPADWEAWHGSSPVPARNFPAQFGYDAVRIPLYLAADPDAPRTTLYPFTVAHPERVDEPGPAVIDVSSGIVGQKMSGAGYRAVFALARCAVHGERIPPALMSSRDTLYYPETLRLLSISIVQERFARCL